MYKKVLVIALVLAALFAVIGGVSAVTWGVPDGNGHPHVVTLLFQRPDGYYSCSGTLLSSRVVLTAGHCTEEGGQENLATWVRNDANIDAAYAAERPNYRSLEAWLNATWISADVEAHPDYADFAGFPNTRDVGVAILRQQIRLPLYGALPTLGQFDYLSSPGNPDNRRFTVVGYGTQAIIPAPFGQSDWVRYVGTTIVTNSNNVYTDGYNFQFSNNPGVGGGTCFGDSGGPAFFGDTNIIAAVTSYGITPNCTGTDYSYRADIAETLNFVTPYLR